MTRYLVMTIKPNGESSGFGFDDYQLARSYARSKSISNRGADVIVNGMGSNMFMYRNGVKCDLGGNELTGNSGHMKKEETIFLRTDDGDIILTHAEREAIRIIAEERMIPTGKAYKIWKESNNMTQTETKPNRCKEVQNDGE